MTLYIGVDIHARQQTVSYLDTEDGSIGQRELHHHWLTHCMLWLSIAVSVCAQLLTRGGRARLQELQLSPIAQQQRNELLSLADELTKRIASVERWLKEQARNDERVTVSMTSS